MTSACHDSNRPRGAVDWGLPAGSPVPGECSGGRKFAFAMPLPRGHLPLVLSLPPRQASLADLMTSAWRWCDDVIAYVMDRLGEEKAVVACAKGCPGNCCRTNVVLLSVPEALCLGGVLFSGPDAAARMHACRLAAAAARNRLDAISGAVPGADPQRLLGRWFTAAGLACPFLSPDGVCDIHPQRPLVCRQWFVTDSWRHCTPAGTDPRYTVRMPVSVTDVLVRATSHLLGRNHEMVVLPALHDWYAANSDLQGRTWPSEEVVLAVAAAMRQLAAGGRFGADAPARGHQAGSSGAVR